MSPGRLNDFDFLTARLHGRRSRLAEGDRLEELCRSGSFDELGGLLYPATEFHAVGDFQRRLAQDLIRELWGFLKSLEGAGADLVAWALVRFQVENIKVLLRSLMRRTPLEAPEEYLLSLPENLALDVPSLFSSGSLEEFAEHLPAGAPRNSLAQAVHTYHEQRRPFFFEAALDCGYFQELFTRTERLPHGSRELVQPLMEQEVDAFHLMLVVRGKFQYGLDPGLLPPLHVSRSRISRQRFNKMLDAPDVHAVARLALRRAIDGLPAPSNAPATVAASALETFSWQRFLRLANRAFRHSHMGLAALFGYIGIRRVEVANLITVSEGILTGLGNEKLRGRMLSRRDSEAIYV
jgi:V/A-type H+-transporting ATPase subunit C